MKSERKIVHGQVLQGDQMMVRCSFCGRWWFRTDQITITPVSRLVTICNLGNITRYYYHLHCAIYSVYLMKNGYLKQWRPLAPHNWTSITLSLHLYHTQLPNVYNNASNIMTFDLTRIIYTLKLRLKSGFKAIVWCDKGLSACPSYLFSIINKKVYPHESLWNYYFNVSRPISLSIKF